MEPVKRHYEETRRLGHSLIQSAAAGVSSTDVEFHLQTLNTTWTTLSDRVLYCFAHVCIDIDFYCIMDVLMAKMSTQ